MRIQGPLCAWIIVLYASAEVCDDIYGGPACDTLAQTEEDHALLQLRAGLEDHALQAAQGADKQSLDGEGSTSAQVWWAPGAMFSMGKLWDRERCESAGRRLTAEHASEPSRPLLIHTEVPFGNVSRTQGGVDPRKERLGLLSFLASHLQNLPTSSLWLWHEEPVSGPLEELLRVVLEHPVYNKSVVLKKFDAAEEFGALAFMNSTAREQMRALWESTDGAPKSDLARYALLYNHGGTWVDSDVLFLKDARPLADRNFVYVNERDAFFNNAVVGTTGPRSRFMEVLLTRISGEAVDGPVGHHAPYGWKVPGFHVGPYRWGGALFQRLYDRPLEFGGEGLSWSVLPACIVDPQWYLEYKELVTWEEFSIGSATEAQVAYLDPRQPEVHGMFLYHWHNRWDERIAKGSFAERVEALYLDILGLPH